MVMNKRDLYRAFSPGKNVRRSIAKRKSINRRSIEKAFNANIKVVVRVRPVHNNESDIKVRSIVKVLDERMLVFDPKEDDDDFYFQGIRQKCRDMTKKSNKEMKFAFDKVFDTDATNEQVFCDSTQEIIGYLLDGYNCSVFVYGATGAGKTYTMLGTRECPGITYLTMVELYQKMELLKEERKFEVAVSYMEVYNEMVKDLISPGQDQLHVREDATYGVKVQGLSVQRPADAAHLLSLLESGNRNRSQHPTDANAESSRSHAVFQVYIKMTSNCLEQGDNGEGSVIKVVKLSMIDLAGSERGSATGFKGSRFAEGSNINKSLLSLGNCINALADGLKHIPYRNSKLTRLLKDSLGGNCKTVMIANVSPAVTAYEDTYNTLKYADRAKKIKLRTKKNVVAIDMHVSELANLVEDLRRENAELKRRIAELEAAGGGGGGGGEEGIPVASTAEKSEDTSTVQSSSVMDKKEEVNRDACVFLNSTFVRCPDIQTAVENKENDMPQEKSFMERVSQVYTEREMLQKKLFQLEAENRIFSWKATSKRRGLMRLQSLCGSQSKEYEKCEAKSLNGEEKTALRLNRIEERKKLAWSQLNENGRKAAQLFKEAKSLTLPKLEEKSQDLKIKGWKCTADHAIRMGILAEKERTQSETILEKVSTTLQHYHNLLSGHGLLTQALEKQHENLVQLVEGIKGVSWQDQLPVQEQEPESSEVTSCEKEDMENKGKLNETFCLNGEDGDKGYIFSHLVSLPVDKIIEHGLCESESGYGDGIDGEIAAMSDGMAKVGLFSSLAPTSILSSILPFAPLTYQFAAPSSTLQKNSTTIPRPSIQPKVWNRAPSGNYSMHQRSFSREKSREDKENSSASEKILQPYGDKNSLTKTSPMRELNTGSARKMMHPKQHTFFGKSHPYSFPGKNRVPLEPRIPLSSNYLSLSVSKGQPSSARKNHIQQSGTISSKMGQLSSFGK